MLRRFAFALLLVLPTTGMAQDVVFLPSFTNDCISAGGGMECIGTSASACMESAETGFSTVGMNTCLDQEVTLWDQELNRAFQSLLAKEEMLDAESDGSDPDRPSGAEMLREMQRVWIAYRDATCNYEIVHWFGGTGASSAWLGCTMRLTGQQAIYLTDILGEG